MWGGKLTGQFTGTEVDRSRGVGNGLVKLFSGRLLICEVRATHL